MITFSLLVYLTIRYNNYILNDLLAFNWYHINWKNYLLIVFYLYSSTRILYSKTYYLFIGHVFFNVFLLAFILYFYQYDVFASLILICESAVILFALFNLINLNPSNFNYSNLFKSRFFFLIFFICFVFIKNCFISNYFYHVIHWYDSINFNYNDFLQIFISVYNSNEFLLIIIGFFLLVLTIYLLFIHFNSLSKNKAFYIDFVKKSQSVWLHLKNNAFIRYFNDFKRK